MENKISGLTLLADKIPIVKAYKQFAWHVNQIKRTEGQIAGADIVSRCMAIWQQDTSKNILNKYKLTLLDIEKPWCTLRYISLASLPTTKPDNHVHLSSFLIGSTAPNVNIVLECDALAHRACWKYYDAFDKKTLPQALQVVIHHLQEKDIQLLNVQDVLHRINFNHLKGFFKKNNITVEKPADKPAVAITDPVPTTTS